MKLYYFCNLDFSLENIRERRLKISRISDLNDPFEFVAPKFTDDDERRAFQKLKPWFNEKNGILCFSQTWQNPLLWSHYADRHKGICLGFDVDEKLVMPVRYVRNRPLLDMRLLIQEKDTETLMRVLSTKYAHWKYEQKMRAFISLDHKTQVGGLYFCNFSDRIRLSDVIVGSNSPASRAQINDVLGELGNQTNVRKARTAFQTFRIVSQRNKSLWE